MEDGIFGGLQHRHKTCCEKGGRHGRRAYRVQRWHHRGAVIFRTGGLAYDTSQDITYKLKLKIISTSAFCTPGYCMLANITSKSLLMGLG